MNIAIVGATGNVGKSNLAGINASAILEASREKIEKSLFLKNKKVIGIAMMKKPHWNVDQDIKAKINGEICVGKVCDLPFI